MDVAGGVVDGGTEEAPEGTVHYGVGHGGDVVGNTLSEQESCEVIGEVVAVVAP